MQIWSVRFQVVIALLLVIAGNLLHNVSRGADGADQARGRPRIDRDEDRFVVRGLPRNLLGALSRADWTRQQWEDLFRVSVWSNDASGRAMLGEYRVSDGDLVFESRFPLAKGLTYQATFRPDKLPNTDGQIAGPVSQKFAIAAPSSVAGTTITAVFPSGDILPENQLKFYVHFSAPMSRGEAYRRVKLIDETGKQVDFPFLELGEELWDPTGTRFTLFFDPGRIKRGLKPRELFGPALEEGRTYTLVVDKGWLDARGNPLLASYDKRFRVAAPDDTQPNLDKWKVGSPKAATRDPLNVVFDEPLDHAMLSRVIAVVDASENKVAGQVEIMEQESRWRFTPDAAWRPGKHALVVDTVLEDRAGNSLGRPFEVDLFEKIDRRIEPETASLRFDVLP